MSKASDVKGLENNPKKQDVRNEIGIQAIDYCKDMKLKKFICFGLPADECRFEHNTNGLFNLMGLSKVELLHYGIERDKTVANMAIKNKPENAILFRGTFHELMTRKITSITKEGIGYIDTDTEDRTKDINFCWSDYCGQPNYELIRNNVGYMLGMVTGMLYITLDISGSHYKGETKSKSGKVGMHKTLGLKGKNIPKEFEQLILKQAKKRGVKNVQCIYNVTYRGGSKQSTEMITLGFMFGDVIANTIRTINRVDLDNTVRKKNYLTYIRYTTNNKRWKAPVKRGRKSLGKVNTYTKATTEQKTIILKMLGSGVDSDKIATKLGVSKKIIGSIKAHITMGTYK